MKKSKDINSTREGRKDLSLQERQEIFRLREHGKSMQEIAEKVECSKSTVSTSLNHSSLSTSHKKLPWYEKGKIVHEATKRNRGRPRSKGWGLKNERIRRYVVEKLKDKLSPMSIHLSLKGNSKDFSISHEAIYLYIYNQDRTLLKYLTKAGQTKRNKRASGQSSRLRAAEIDKRRLEQRPTEANERVELEPVFKEEELKVFFCDPYSPWQRGTVEAIIGILRRWFPKGTNFDDVSEQKVEYVEAWFNNRPMEVLNGETPNEVFYQELALMA